MKKIALLLMVLAVVSKLFGFFRELALSFFYGAGQISDAYIIATTIPLTIFTLFSVTVNSGYIPVYNQVEKDLGSGHARKFTNNFVNTILLIATALVVLVLIFTRQVVIVFASGFDEDTLAIAILFTRITIFAVYFKAVISIFKGYLRIHDNYWVPAIITIPFNVIIVLGIAVSSLSTPVVLAVSFLVGAIIQLIVFWPFIRKHKYRYKPYLKLKDKNLHLLFLMLGPIFIQVAVNDINQIVARTIASNIVVGGVSALNYARQLKNVVMGVIVLAVTTSMFPMISKMAAHNDLKGLKTTLKESVNVSTIIILPAAVGMLLFSEEIVRLLYGRGAFDETAISLTSSALFFYSIGLLSMGMVQVFSRAFYALKDTKTPVINAVIGISINIALSVIVYFFTDWGIPGLALAQSISAIITSLLLAVSLRKKLGRIGMKNMLTVFTKVVVAATLMGIIAKGAQYFALSYTNFHDNLITIAAIGLAVIVYIGVIIFMRIEDVDIMVNLLKQRFKNGKNSNGIDDEM